MSFTHPIRRSVPVLIGLAAMLAFMPGCLFSPDDDDGPPDETRIPERTSAQGAVKQYAYIWTHKLLPEYESLLHDEFEYFPYVEDPNDFPWMTGDSWGRTEELGMARNMFDEEYVDPDQSDGTQQAIDTIDMKIVDILSEQTTVDGIVIRAHVDAQVLWEANSGARSDVYFEFTVIGDTDEPGLFQIRDQREFLQ